MVVIQLNGSEQIKCLIESDFIFSSIKQASPKGGLRYYTQYITTTEQEII
jgi:hypothetical protein